MLIDGRDPFAGPEPCDHGLSCRIYRSDHGHPVPSLTQLRDALAAADERTHHISPPARQPDHDEES